MVTSLSLHFGLLVFVFNSPTPETEKSPPPLVTFIEAPKYAPLQDMKLPKKSLVNKSKSTTKHKESRKSLDTRGTGHKKLKRKTKQEGKGLEKKSEGKGEGFRFSDFSPSSKESGTFSDHQARHQGGWAGNEIMETMNGMGLGEYSENHYFFEVLVNHLNRMIPYPKELWEHKIEGKIWVKVQVNREGQLLRVIDASKNAPVLSAYVLVNIFQALEHSLPRRYWYSRDKDLALMLSFDYSVTSIPTAAEIQNARYFKNRFEFERVAKIPNFLQETMRDYARYVPPIAPTPMGPIVNFVQVYHMIQAWRGDDPLLKKKNKELFTREKMQRLLEQSKKRHQNK